MHPVDKLIWKTFHVHHGDVSPFCGWHGTRNTLAEMFNILGYKVGAEIGVQEGYYSETICRACRGIKLWCIDTWAPFSTHDQEWQDRQYHKAVVRLSPYDAELVKKASIEAVKDFEDGSLDFVYIDAMHDFDNVMMDIISWSPKVRKDGIIAGHDYEHYYSCGVPQAVDAYTRAHHIELYYLTPKDPPRSWFWRKG